MEKKKQKKEKSRKQKLKIELVNATLSDTLSPPPTSLEDGVVAEEGEEGPGALEMLLQLGALLRREAAGGVAVHAGHSSLEGPGGEGGGCQCGS